MSNIEVNHSSQILLYMHHLQIRKASVADVNILVAISRQTFYETFYDTNTPENLQKYLNQSFNEEKLLEELNNPESEFYFALVHQQVAGYLKINRGEAQNEYKNDGGLEIERIYVLQEYIGKSVGQALLDYALSIAAELKCKFVWLGVWEKNYRAIRFYEKNGFVIAGQHIFNVGDDPQTDLIMVKN